MYQKKKCYFCDKPAVGSIGMFMEGKASEIDVCEEHMQELNKTIATGLMSLALTPFMPSMFEQMKKYIMKEVKPGKGEFECPHCHELLRTFIFPMLQSIHRTYHMPRKAALGMKEEELQQKIQVAIQNQDFELAAKLRDEIKKLKEEK